MKNGIKNKPATRGFFIFYSQPPWKPRKPVKVEVEEALEL
jgi:hypothetical protein